MFKWCWQLKTFLNFLLTLLDKKDLKKTAEEEVAEDVEQIVAFLKETDPANNTSLEIPAPQSKFFWYIYLCAFWMIYYTSYFNKITQGPL